MTESVRQEASLPILVFRLRALILTLGESSTPKWWSSDFMSSTGLSFLERIYPRTALRAAVNAAGRAATDVHDKAVGRYKVFHLFRLPENLESDIHRLASDADTAFEMDLRSAFGQQEKLMVLLAQPANNSTTESTAGAQRLGTDEDLKSPLWVKNAAAVYLHAFAQHHQAFPYFIFT